MQVLIFAQSSFFYEKQFINRKNPFRKIAKGLRKVKALFVLNQQTIAIVLPNIIHRSKKKDL